MMRLPDPKTIERRRSDSARLTHPSRWPRLRPQAPTGMKTSVVPELAGSAKLDEAPEPGLELGSVLLEALAVDVCGTDVEIATGRYGWSPAGWERMILTRVPWPGSRPGVEQAHLEDTIRRMLYTYRHSLPHDRQKLLDKYHYVHAARKVVGVGSVGTRAWVLLMLGRDEDDPLFLQFKEAQASVLEPFLGKSEFAEHGQRVVGGQRTMQMASDIMLGWERIITIDGQSKDFYIRQLWDAKGSAEVELMNPADLAAYGVVCGWTLAKAHARSGDQIAIAAYLGNGDTFDRAIATFAETYADQNERDYQALQEAAASSRVAIQTGI
jgi:hypothetical protein